MILLELFDKPLKFKKHDHSSDIGGIPVDTYAFTTSNDVKYLTIIYKIEDFRQAGLDISDSGIGIDFRNLNVSSANQEGITKTGNEIEVFATVIAIATEAINKHKPEIIAFGAHESSRQKLYSRMVNILKRKFGYELVEDDIVNFPLGKSKYYVLRKK